MSTQIETPHGTVTLKFLPLSVIEAKGFAAQDDTTYYFPYSNEFLEAHMKPELLDFAKALNRHFTSQSEVDEVARGYRWFGVRPWGRSGFILTGVRDSRVNNGNLFVLLNARVERDKINDYCPSDMARRFVEWVVLTRTPKTYEEVVARVEAYYAQGSGAIEVGTYVRFAPTNNLTAATFFGVATSSTREGTVTRVFRPTEEGLLCVELDDGFVCPILCVAKVDGPETFEVTQYTGDRGSVIEKVKASGWRIHGRPTTYVSAEHAIKASASRPK